MKTSPWLKREAFIVVHGQSVRFRMVKYAILIPIFAGIYAWAGWTVTWITLVVLFVLGVAIHLLFRWKTHAWTRSWGPYKEMKLPE